MVYLPNINCCISFLRCHYPHQVKGSKLLFASSQPDGSSSPVSLLFIYYSMTYVSWQDKNFDPMGKVRSLSRKKRHENAVLTNPLQRRFHVGNIFKCDSDIHFE